MHKPIVFSLAIILLFALTSCFSSHDDDVLPPLANNEVELAGLVLENANPGKQVLSKNSNIGINAEAFAGTPATGNFIVLLSSTQELDRDEVDADGAYVLRYDFNDLDTNARLTVVIENSEAQVLASMEIMPLNLAARTEVVMNVELCSSWTDTRNPALDAMVIFLGLADDLDIVVDNAIDSNNDGIRDSLGARASFGDNLLLFDRDLDGNFGEQGDVVIHNVPASLFDDDLADGYQHDLNGRNLSVGDAQDAVTSISLQYQPSSIVGDSANQFSALLMVTVTRAGADSLFGAEIEIESDTGDFAGTNPITVTIDPTDPRVRMFGNGLAFILLSHDFTPNTTGTIVTTATANNDKPDASASLNIMAVASVPGNPPSILNASPVNGSTLGGTALTITGTDFQDDMIILFGDIPADDVIFINTQTVTCTSPPASVGQVDVTVINTDGQSDSLSNGFTYIAPGVTVVQSGNTEISEGDISDTYTIVLDASPYADVVLNITADAQSSVDLSRVTFSTSNWSTSQTITVSAIDDDIAEANHNSTIQHSAASLDAFYNEITVVDVDVSLTDNDSAAVNLAHSNGSTDISEGGATDSYTVVLNSEPTSDVIISISTDTQSTVDINALTFSAANWSISQTITVTSIDDDVAEGNHNSSIQHSSSSLDTFYDAIVIGNIAVSLTDNDTAAITIVQSGGSTNVTEGGTTDSYTIVLGSEPVSNVSITISSDAQATVDLGTVTFTATNWSLAQTVIVTAIDDDIAEGNHNSTIQHNVASLDVFYDVFVIVDINSGVIDNDSAGVSVAQSNGSTDVTEGGLTDAYTVVLTTEPTADVAITIAPDTQSTTNVNVITFTAANWSLAQTVTVTAVDDSLIETSQSSMISHSAVSTDGNYHGIDINAVTANLTDNDFATVAFQNSSSATANESAANHSVTVELSTTNNSTLLIDFTVDVTSTGGAASAGSDYVAVSETITFLAGSGDGDTQTVDISILQDILIDGDETVILGLSNPSATGSLAGQTTHTATITDDDIATIAFQNASSTTANETVSNHSVTVELSTTNNSTLIADLTVEVNSTDGSAFAGSDYTAVSETITFSAGSTDGATQTVDIPILHDVLIEGNETVILTLSNPSANGSLGIQSTHTATINDDEVAIRQMIVVDTIGTVASPGDLRQISPVPETGTIVMALGFWAEGDGGGGTFYVSDDNLATDNGGTIILGNGIVLQRFYSGSVNVKWFGAVGDGVTDDTSAFVAANAASKNMHLSVGDTYCIQNWVPLANTTVSCYGATIERHNSTDLYSTTGSMASIVITNDNIKILGGTHRAKSLAPTWSGSIIIENGDNIIIKDAEITASWGGIFGHIEQNGALEASNVLIESCTFHDCGHNNYFSDIDGLTINNCRSYNSAKDGFKLARNTRNIIMTNNYIYDNGDASPGPKSQDGIDLYIAGYRCVITGNHIYNNATHGLDIKTAPDTAGEEFQDSEYIIANNYIHDNETSGISVRSDPAPAVNMKNFSITNNHIFNNLTWGMRIDFVENLNIATNQIYSNGRNGIRVANSSGLIVQNNIIYDNGTAMEAAYRTGVVVLDSVANALIKKNVIYSSASSSSQISGIGSDGTNIRIFDNFCYGHAGVNVSSANLVGNTQGKQIFNSIDPNTPDISFFLDREAQITSMILTLNGTGQVTVTVTKRNAAGAWESTLVSETIDVTGYVPVYLNLTIDVNVRNVLAARSLYINVTNVSNPFTAGGVLVNYSD